MSSNKFRYYSVDTHSVVKANSQTDAINLVFGYDVPGELLSQDVDAMRVTANEARSLAD